MLVKCLYQPVKGKRVSVAGCLGYDVLEPANCITIYDTGFQLLVV